LKVDKLKMGSPVKRVNWKWGPLFCTPCTPCTLTKTTTVRMHCVEMCLVVCASTYTRQRIYATHLWTKLCVSEKETGLCSCVPMFMMRLFAVTVRNVAVGLWLVFHTCYCKEISIDFVWTANEKTFLADRVSVIVPSCATHLADDDPNKDWVRSRNKNHHSVDFALFVKHKNSWPCS